MGYERSAIKKARDGGLRSTGEGRYHHRLHCALLVASGMSSRHVAGLFGDSPRAVQTWVKRYEALGAEGLRDRKRGGRPARLTRHQIEMLSSQISTGGKSRDDRTGESLSELICREYGVRLGIRQCQRILQGMRKKDGRAGPAPGMDD